MAQIGAVVKADYHGAMIATPLSAPLRQDLRTIGLVGLAHGTSHFFHMLLPPLFPWLVGEFGLSWSELGFLVTVFFVISGVGQALSGFLVDRVGARPVLFAALMCFVLAAIAAASAQGYVSLVAAAALAGLGNSPFHPVDFTILNKRVSQGRLGHAFSAHGVSGNLGWAIAPVFLAGIATASQSWRIACVAAAVYAMAVLVLMIAKREALDDSSGVWSHESQPLARGRPDDEHALAFLKLPSVWLCMSFFFWLTCALAAVQSFASPSLHKLYDLPLTTTSIVVTGFMLAGAIGTIAGGFFVNGVARLEWTISVAILSSAAALALAGSGVLSGPAAAALASLAGLGTGIAAPSRDMLIKRAAPPRATGRVYGTVYSGLDLGFAVSAPIFGAMLDRGHADAVFYGAALALVAGVFSALVVGGIVAGRQKTSGATATVTR